jgi:hypothetical protein
LLCSMVLPGTSVLFYIKFQAIFSNSFAIETVRQPRNFCNSPNRRRVVTGRSGVSAPLCAAPATPFFNAMIRIAAPRGLKARR